VKCKTCQFFTTKTTPGKASWLLFECKERKLLFGLERDFLAGKWHGSAADQLKYNISDVPIKCKFYKERGK
jgi:hypothetical protein